MQLLLEKHGNYSSSHWTTSLWFDGGGQMPFLRRKSWAVHSLIASGRFLSLPSKKPLASLLGEISKMTSCSCVSAGKIGHLSCLTPSGGYKVVVKSLFGLSTNSFSFRITISVQSIHYQLLAMWLSGILKETWAGWGRSLLRRSRLKNLALVRWFTQTTGGTESKRYLSARSERFLDFVHSHW